MYDMSNLCEMCKKCIKRHVATKGEFKVKCIPMPKEMEREEPYFPLEKFIKPETYFKLSEDTKLDLQLKYNKILWAKKYLGWSSYNETRGFKQFYQNEFLICNAQNRVMRFGRRMGKCVEENTLITTENRGLVPANKLSKGDILYAYDEKTNQMLPTKKWIMTDNGRKQCLQIITESGKIDVVTYNHPYLINNKWIEAKDLRIGDKVTVPLKLPKFQLFKKIEKENYGLYKGIGEMAGKNENIGSFAFRLNRYNTSFLLEGILKKKCFKNKFFVQQIGYLLQRTGTKYKICKAGECYEIQILDRYHESKEFAKEKIVSITNVGFKNTLAISVNEYHTFLTNGIITHNTESMGVDILHYACNNPNRKIVIVAPFQNLTTEIFDRLEKLLSSEKSAYVNSYSRKRSPSEKITLQNGTTISGFTTATDGKSIRGQSADRLYIDEGDYIPPQAFSVLMAFKLDNSEVSFTVASTPSGLESNFKRWCKVDKEWRDFHYPSTILPNYEQEKENFKNSMTEDEFNKEILAEFSEDASKLFKTDDIIDACKEYQYYSFREQLPDPLDWKIAIGVDYNEFKNGSQICVLGLKTRNIKEGEKPLKVLRMISLKKNSNEGQIKDLQTHTVNTIIDQFNNFGADWVYCDQGHGSMQNEMLSKYFFDLGMQDVFKGVNFSSNYTIEDLFTGQNVNKRMKVMMVNFLQKRFERRDIEISALEENKKADLVDQLKEYHIQKYDSKEQPVFKGTDHKLDALMLANFALVENLDQIFDRSTGAFVAPIKHLNYKNLSGTNNQIDEMLNKYSQQQKYSGMHSNEVNIIKRHKRFRGGSYGFFEY